MTLQWRLFNLLTRRVLAPAFVVVGSLIAAENFSALLPGGTVNVNSAPSSNIVFRLVSFLLPLFVAVSGALLYRAKPYVPAAQEAGR